MQAFVIRFMNVDCVFATQEPPYRANTRFRIAKAIHMPNNGTSPGSGTCTASAFQALSAIFHTKYGMRAATDSLRRRSAPRGDRSGTTRACAGSAIPPSRGGTRTMTSVMSSNSDPIAAIWKGNPPKDIQRPDASCQQGLNEMAHTRNRRRARLGTATEVGGASLEVSTAGITTTIAWPPARRDRVAAPCG